MHFRAKNVMGAYPTGAMYGRRCCHMEAALQAPLASADAQAGAGRLGRAPGRPAERISRPGRRRRHEARVPADRSICASARPGGCCCRDHRRPCAGRGCYLRACAAARPSRPKRPAKSKQARHGYSSRVPGIWSRAVGIFRGAISGTNNNTVFQADFQSTDRRGGENGSEQSSAIS